MSVVALPQWLAGRNRRVRTAAMALALVLVFAVILYLAFAGNTSSPGTAQIITYDVAPMDLEIRINKDGEIQAIDNIDVTCQVEGSSTITTIIKEGTSVKKGDLLLTLDSTTIRQRMEDTSLELQKAEADVSNAREMLEIQKSSNDTNLESADVALRLAELDLKQYTEGSYPQQVASAKTELEMAQIALNNKLEDLQQTRKLYAKNFVTAGDLKKAELDVTTARNTLDKATTALTVLTVYSHDADLTAKNSTLLQAKQKVQRTRRENNSNLSWRQADLTAKEQNLLILQRRFNRLKEQFAACSVTAPADGMVVYGSSSDRSAQNPIQEGAQVRERQLLVRLPDTSAMKAVVRIHESVVSRLKEGQKAMVNIVGQPAPVPGKILKISVLADSSQRWWNPDLREYPVDIAIDKTPASLKPGIGASVEILVDRIPQTIAVPLDTVYTVGGDRYVFIKDGDSPRPVKIKVGANNETHVQVLEGLSAGQRVLRLQAGQGRDLLEKSGIKVAPTTAPSKGKQA